MNVIYKMMHNLSVRDHLGINLCSNIAAVLNEAVTCASAYRRQDLRTEL